MPRAVQKVSPPVRVARITTNLFGLLVLSLALLDAFGPLTRFSETIGEADHIRRPPWVIAFLFVYSGVLLAPRIVNQFPGVSVTRTIIAWAGTVWIAAIAVDFVIGLARGNKDPLGLPVVAALVAMAVVAAFVVGVGRRRLET